eukprot:763630-Hanusia_phi.AAC.1
MRGACSMGAPRHWVVHPCRPSCRLGCSSCCKGGRGEGAMLNCQKDFVLAHTLGPRPQPLLDTKKDTKYSLQTDRRFLHGLSIQYDSHSLHSLQTTSKEGQAHRGKQIRTCMLLLIRNIVATARAAARKRSMADDRRCMRLRTEMRCHKGAQSATGESTLTDVDGPCQLLPSSNWTVIIARVKPCTKSVTALPHLRASKRSSLKLLRRFLRASSA